MKCFLELQDCQPRIPDLQFKMPVSWRLCEGEYWAIIGDNGAGKSVLADLICGKYALKSGEIKYHFLEGSDLKAWQAVQLLSFDSVYGLADFHNTYYQQRWHSSENEDMPSVGDILGDEADEKTMGLFGVNLFREKKINYLSSGELRKFLITKTLLEKPKLLIIDNPYIGLDAVSRNLVRESLKNLCDCGDMKIIFMFSAADDMPDFITHVLPVSHMQVGEPTDIDSYLSTHPIHGLTAYPIESTSDKGDNAPVVELNKIVIRYGNKTVMDGVDWQIYPGDKWVLSGRNGSGKSTLLSLINADHPQAYANDISFFGRKRGVGQSIWEVKKLIGYVSPEMHTHYYQNIPAVDVVGSGLFDTIGTIRKCDEDQAEQCLKWMEKFGITYLKDKSFIKLSSGEQRLVLLARAFVKEPTLLILDEPLHGLDIRNKNKVRNLIDEYCCGNDVTLIYVSHYLNEIPKCINKHFQLGYTS